MEDLQLVREYAERRSERAFTELVHRHMDFVYSTARRVVQESQTAEDITQLVFIRLARKAGSLRGNVILTGWLYRTTQFVAQTVQRSDWRRRHRERLAMESSELNSDPASVWKEVAPLIEEAMQQLRPADQDAVLLRYFAGKSLREVGETLGLSDDTAQKRVNRALEKMRAYFARHGVTVSSAVMAPAIAAHAVQAAPAALASSLVAASLASPAVGLGPLSAFKFALLAPFKVAGPGLLLAALLLFTGVAFVVQTRPGGSKAGTGAFAAPPPAAAFILRGTVHGPDGGPLTGAVVRVATPQNYLRLYQPTNSVLPTNAIAGRTNTTGGTNSSAPVAKQAPSAVTAADGSFVIGLPERPRDGLAAVLVDSDAGYALVTAEELAANPDVVVQPWARLEGVLRVGKSVASNATVNIGIWGATELYDWNLVYHGASTRTDANGRFVFPRIAPVDVWLTRTVNVRTNDGRQSGHRYVKVLPGDRLQVQLGGVGRTLTGRVTWDGTNDLDFYGSMWANAAPGIRHPKNWREMSREEQRRYDRAWRETPAAEPWKKSVRNYEFPVDPDGTFQVVDVLPGSYRMQVRADEPRPDGKGMRHAAEVEIRVDVPELSGDESDEPIDLGVLVPRPTLHR